MEVDATPTDKDQVKLVAEQQQEKQLKLLGSHLPKRGHTLFEVEIATGEISVAKLEGEIVIGIDGQQTLTRKIVSKDGFAYVSALNKKNALKKLAK
jgi:hypothetical protein